MIFPGLLPFIAPLQLFLVGLESRNQKTATTGKICTAKYKAESDNRARGVGYEWHHDSRGFCKAEPQYVHPSSCQR